MNFRKSLAVLAITALFALPLSAQVKIGYTNIEVVLSYMPETKSIDQQLQLYQKKLGEQLKVKEDFANMKLQEYQEGMESNAFSPEEKANREKELMALDEDLKKRAQQSEFDLMAKRQELLEPVLDKLQKTIDATAAEKGYTYILNQTTSGGVSTILYGPEEDDITEIVMKKLGIVIPEN